VGKGWDWDSIQQLLYANPKVKNVAFYIKCRDQIHANGVPVEPVRLDRFFYTLQVRSSSFLLGHDSCLPGRSQR
jgi:hypothetical protein